MVNEFVSIITGIVLILLTAFILYYVFIKKKSTSRISIHSSFDKMRAVGHLSVFKAYTKEIVTEIDHSWGEIGKKYLSWIISVRKMVMIFEFEIDFRYDLKSKNFRIENDSKEGYIIQMPPCFYDVNIRNIRFYDEKGSRLLPWLLPDLISGFFMGRFSEEEKNKLVDAARSTAQQQALTLIDSLEIEVQNSAKSTLSSMCQAFGVMKTTFQFMPGEDTKLNISMDEKVTA